MTTRHIVKTIGAVVLAALVGVGTAGAASAAFSAKTATSQLTASTLKLQPPTGLNATCKTTGANHAPTVTFTSSASVGVVADHPARTPPQVMGYVTGLTVNGTVDPAGTSTLGAQATQWTGTSRKGNNTLVFTITTTYGGWTSAAATVTFQC